MFPLYHLIFLQMLVLLLSWICLGSRWMFLLWDRSASGRICISLLLSDLLLRTPSWSSGGLGRVWSGLSFSMIARIQLRRLATGFESMWASVPQIVCVDEVWGGWAVSVQTNYTFPGFLWRAGLVCARCWDVALYLSLCPSGGVFRWRYRRTALRVVEGIWM